MNAVLSRRALLPLAASLAVATAAAPRLARAQATPRSAAARRGHLVVADPAAAKLSLYGLGDLAPVAEVDGLTPNTHAGFLALPDGRLLFVDDATDELVALRLDGAAGPAVVGRAAVPATVSHIAADPALAFAVVGAVDERRPLTLVDLGDFSARSFDVEAGEAGVMLGGDPLRLFHRNDALLRVESYPVAALTGEAGGATPESGSGPTPAAVVETGAAGHGEAISHELGRLYLATDDGLDVVEIVPDGLAYRTTVPWAVSGRAGGRAYYVRLANDGRHLVSYVADRSAEERAWPTYQNDAYLVDLATDEARRVEIGPGLVYRFGLADRAALFFNLHPDGDAAHLLDLDPASATFGEIVARIPLDPLTNGPRAGESPWEAESRIAALTRDGGLGFVSHGGDGVVSVIDTAAGEVVGRIETPTPLAFGGYLVVVEEEAPFADTVAR